MTLGEDRGDIDPLDAFIDLTPEEIRQLQNLARGAPHVSRARNELIAFGHSKGWSSAVREDVLRLVREL